MKLEKVMNSNFFSKSLKRVKSTTVPLALKCFMQYNMFTPERTAASTRQTEFVNKVHCAGSLTETHLLRFHVRLIRFTDSEEEGCGIFGNLLKNTEKSYKNQ